MFINKKVIVFLFICSMAFSQSKKVDTVFVYEKVFVYKSVSKKAHAVSFDSISKIKSSEINPYKVTIPIDSSLFKIISASAKQPKKKPQKWSAIDNYGIAVQSLFSQQPEIRNYGAGIGFYATKNIYKNKLFLNFGFSYSKVFGETEIESVDGYYLTPDAVLQYKPKNSVTQQLDFPITVSWKYGKFKPRLGVAFTQKKTGLDFFAYRSNNLITTAEKVSYQLTTSYVDFNYGLDYEVSKRMGLCLKTKQTLVNLGSHKVNENLKSLEELHFFPNQVIFGVNYNFKK